MTWQWILTHHRWRYTPRIKITMESANQTEAQKPPPVRGSIDKGTIIKLVRDVHSIDIGLLRAGTLGEILYDTQPGSVSALVRLKLDGDQRVVLIHYADMAIITPEPWPPPLSELCTISVCEDIVPLSETDYSTMLASMVSVVSTLKLTKDVTEFSQTDLEFITHEITRCYDILQHTSKEHEANKQREQREANVHIVPF